jgi:hypothetical protein
MKVYFFKQNGGNRHNPYESISEPYGKPHYEVFLARDLMTGKVFSMSVDDLEGREVYTEPMRDTFMTILNNFKD